MQGFTMPKPLAKLSPDGPSNDSSMIKSYSNQYRTTITARNGSGTFLITKVHASTANDYSISLLCSMLYSHCIASALMVRLAILVLRIATPGSRPIAKKQYYDKAAAYPNT